MNSGSHDFEVYAQAIMFPRVKGSQYKQFLEEIENEKKNHVSEPFCEHQRKRVYFSIWNCMQSPGNPTRGFRNTRTAHFAHLKAECIGSYKATRLPYGLEQVFCPWRSIFPLKSSPKYSKYLQWSSKLTFQGMCYF